MIIRYGVVGKSVFIRVPQEYATAVVGIVWKGIVSHGQVVTIYKRDLSDVAHVLHCEMLRFYNIIAQFGDRVALVVVIVYLLPVCCVVAPDVIVIRLPNIRDLQRILPVGCEYGVVA